MENKKNDLMRCRLCGFSSAKFGIVGDFVYGGNSEQKFYLCPRCDVAFLYPPMRPDDEKKFYAKEFEKFMEKRAGKDFDWSGPQAHLNSNKKQYKRRLRFISKFIDRGKRVLEIGCSSGFMLLPLKKRGMEVVGVEPSKGFTSFLKKKNIKVYESIDQLEKLNDQGKKFDLIMHFFVLEHISDPEDFLKRTLKLLSKNGVMVFEVPSRSDPLISIYNLPAFQKFYWSVAHNYYFNKKSLEYLLARVCNRADMLPEQRYDLSNHIVWATKGIPGGQGKYSSFFTSKLQKAYLESMMQKGYCDTYVGVIFRKDLK